MYPIVRDLTQSLRIGDWDGYMWAVQRSLPLFFAYGRTNYSRYGPIFFEECMNLKQKFPNRPDELPEPCTCGKCARESCACRYADIPCCVYCKCKREDCCQNPNNPKNH